MEFNSFADFLQMGRHGFYVWLSYGITAVIIVVNLVQPHLRRRQLLKEQAQRLRRESQNASSTKTTA